MRKGSLSIVELHVEKGVAALATLFALYAAVIYLPSSPHTVEYKGESVGPDNVAEQIYESAQTLDSRIRSAEPEDFQIKDYASLVKTKLRSSILSGGDEAPPINPTLPRVTTFGKPIKIPGESGDARRDVRLVQPLAPTKPVATTGRSQVIYEQMELLPDGAAQPAFNESEPQTRDVGWVSVAAYWDHAAQKRTHEEAGYVSYRVMPYAAAVRAQRQYMTSDGEWSAWEDVKPDRAMPRIAIPEPEYDAATNQLMNKGDIDAMFQVIKANQLTVVQPPFYEVVRGNEWFVPPLAGHTPKDWEKAQEALETEPEENRRTPDRRDNASFNPYAAGGGGNNPYARDGAFGGGSMGGRTGGERANRDRGDRGESSSDARERAEADFESARQAYLDHDYQAALDYCDQVIENERARTTVRRDAESLKEKLESLTLAVNYGLPRWAASGQQADPAVRKPAENEVIAVWFHDDTADPRRTYRYRLRVDVWNRYFDEPADLANPEEAEQVFVAGRWSEPSDPVKPIPDAFFVPQAVRVDPTNNQTSVRMDIWKWNEGWWVSQRFDVNVGEQIGGAATVEVQEFGVNDEGDEELMEVRREVDFSTGLTLVGVREESPEADDTNLRAVRTTYVQYRIGADGPVLEKEVELRGGANPNYAAAF